MMLLDCSIDDCCDESDGMMMMNDDADVVGHDSDRQLEMVNALYCNDDCHLRHWDGTDHDYIRDGLMNRMNNSIVHHYHVIDNHHLDHSSNPGVTHVVNVDTVHWKSDHRGDSVVAHISNDSHEIDDSQDWAIGLYHYHHDSHRDISIHTSSLWLHTVLAAAAHYYYEEEDQCSWSNQSYHHSHQHSHHFRHLPQVHQSSYSAGVTFQNSYWPKGILIRDLVIYHALLTLEEEDHCIQMMEEEVHNLHNEKVEENYCSTRYFLDYNDQWNVHVHVPHQ